MHFGGAMFSTEYSMSAPELIPIMDPKLLVRLLFSRSVV